MLRFIAVILLIALGGLWLSCGGDCRVLLSGGVVVGCGDEPPGPGDPAFGSLAEMLIRDCRSGDLLWVGVAAPTPPTPGPGPTPTPSPSAFAEIEALRCEGTLNWIGGTVRAAQDHPNGFFFDPDEILAVEDAAPEIQTTIQAIAADPDFFEPTGDGGEEQWVVPAEVVAIETAEPIGCPLAAVCVP